MSPGDGTGGHSSCSTSSRIGQTCVRSYERMEFLGDALLDYSVVPMLYNQLPSAHEGILAGSKTLIIENKSLAQESIRMRLYELIYAKDSVLSQLKHLKAAVDDAVDMKRLSQHVQISGSCAHLYQYYAPWTMAEESYVLADVDGKIKTGISSTITQLLADVLESLVGAVFVDCGRDYTVIDKVISKVLRLDKRIGDIRDIYETLSKRGID